MQKGKTKRKCFTGKCRGMRRDAPGPASYAVHKPWGTPAFGGSSKNKRIKGAKWSTAPRFGSAKPVYGMSLSAGPALYNGRSSVRPRVKGGAWSTTRRPCSPNPRRTPKRRSPMDMSSYNFSKTTKSSARKAAKAEKQRSRLCSTYVPKSVERPAWAKRTKTAPKSHSVRPSKSCLKKTKRGGKSRPKTSKKVKTPKKVAFAGPPAAAVAGATKKSKKRAAKVSKPKPAKEATPPKEPTPEPVDEREELRSEESVPPVDRLASLELEDMDAPIPRLSTPPPEEIEAVLRSMTSMGIDCDESEPPRPIKKKEHAPESFNDEEEETRSQRRARILKAQREAMWSDDESEDAKSEEEKLEPLTKSLSQLYSADPAVEERIGAIQTRVDQLKALLASCPESNRAFVTGHISRLEAEVSALKGSDPNADLIKVLTPEESDEEESESEDCSEEVESEEGSDEEWGSDGSDADISDLSDLQALIASHGL